ncbi:protein DOWN-REGULATED IN DIF1 11-like [Neltuma alba]|uniref:protein DOWN-REGULATED IN DIF1 11-like n=1 Tax=Neltuma alba TaxID=207710 RepID=UPI0010A46FDD|nr:protein DOWN-REGULATED IN DIF1 11-like [Prosopis alba]
MAAAKYVFAMAILFVGVSVLWATPGVVSSEAPSSSSSSAAAAALSPEQDPKFHEYLRQCSKKFKKCGPLAYDAVVFKNATMTNQCCYNLVKDVGKSCFDNLLTLVLHSPAFKANASAIKESNRQVWNHCSFMSNWLD